MTVAASASAGGSWSDSAVVCHCWSCGIHQLYPTRPVLGPSLQSVAGRKGPLTSSLLVDRLSERQVLVSDTEASSQSCEAP